MVNLLPSWGFKELKYLSLERHLGREMLFSSLNAWDVSLSQSFPFWSFKILSTSCQAPWWTGYAYPDINFVCQSGILPPGKLSHHASGRWWRGRTLKSSHCNLFRVYSAPNICSVLQSWAKFLQSFFIRDFGWMPVCIQKGRNNAADNLYFSVQVPRLRSKPKMGRVPLPAGNFGFMDWCVAV